MRLRYLTVDVGDARGGSLLQSVSPHPHQNIEIIYTDRLHLNVPRYIETGVTKFSQVIRYFYLNGEYHLGNSKHPTSLSCYEHPRIITEKMFTVWHLTKKLPFQIKWQYHQFEESIFDGQ